MLRRLVSVAALAAVAAAAGCGGGDPAVEPTPDAAPPVPPQTTITEGPAEVTSATTAIFVFTSDRSGVVYECTLDGVPMELPCTSPTMIQAAEGEHTFTVRAVVTVPDRIDDETPASHTWRIDLTRPLTTIVSGPSEDMPMSEAVFTFDASEEASFECALDGGALELCDSGVSYSELAMGPHTLAVRAVDRAANVGAEVTWSWTVTSITPNTRLLEKPESPWRDPRVTFEFEASVDGASFECRINVEAAEPCASPMIYDLDEGDWSFEVSAIDPGGQRDPTPARHTFTIRYPFW